MKPIRRVATLVAAGLVPLAAVAVSPSPAGAAPAVSAASKSRVYVRDCLGTSYRVKPGTFVVACGDGGVYVKSIRWSNWGARRAHGSGTLGENNCIPNCARGHFHFEPTSITLTRLARRHGRRDYGYVTVLPKAPNRYHFRNIRYSLPN